MSSVSPGPLVPSFPQVLSPVAAHEFNTTQMVLYVHRTYEHSLTGMKFPLDSSQYLHNVTAVLFRYHNKGK